MDRNNTKTRQDIKKVNSTGTLPYFNRTNIRTAQTIPEIRIAKEANKKSKFDGTYRIVNTEE